MDYDDLFIYDNIINHYNLDIDYNNFNKPARDQTIIQFQDIHDVSWQVNLVNELMYGNPNGNGVVRNGKGVVNTVVVTNNVGGDSRVIKGVDI